MERLVKENCDILVTIPMKGKINSLNASASSAIVMYEVVKQRLNKQRKQMININKAKEKAKTLSLTQTKQE